MLTLRMKQGAALASLSLRQREVAVNIAGALLRGQFGMTRRLARLALRASDLRTEKVVSRKHRYLWICNPKVASRSIIAALQGADPDAELIRNKSVSEIYALYPEVRDYFSFAFIRHPFDRALSFYSEVRFSPERYEGAQRLHKEEKQQEFFKWSQGLGDVRSFDDYCRWLNTPYGEDAFADRHFRSQNLMIRLDDGRLPDFVGRMENIEEDLKRVAMKVSMPVPVLPMLNTMAGWQPASQDELETARSAMRVHLTERNRELLRIRYADDLELGGYSPT